jgi:AbiTii
LKAAYWGSAVATSLIHELQLDAANAAVSASSLLRKALIVAAKLDVANVPEWIDKELSGYRDGDSVPSYRVVQGTVKGRGVRGWLSLQFPTDELEEKVATKYLYDSVAQIEALRNRDGMLAVGFTAEGTRLLQQLAQRNTEFVCELDKTKLDAIIDEIKNRVLRWAIALDKDGIRGEGLTFTSAEVEKAHSMVFQVESGDVNVGVIGDVGGRANVATGRQPRAGSIDMDDVRKLAEDIAAHIETMRLSTSDHDELKETLRQLTTTNCGKTAESGIVRQALARILALVGKAS